MKQCHCWFCPFKVFGDRIPLFSTDLFRVLSRSWHDLGSESKMAWNELSILITKSKSRTESSPSTLILSSHSEMFCLFSFSGNLYWFVWEEVLLAGEELNLTEVITLPKILYWFVWGHSRQIWEIELWNKLNFYPLLFIFESPNGGILCYTLDSLFPFSIIWICQSLTSSCCCKIPLSFSKILVRE